MRINGIVTGKCQVHVVIFPQKRNSKNTSKASLLAFLLTSKGLNQTAKSKKKKMFSNTNIIYP